MYYTFLSNNIWRISVKKEKQKPSELSFLKENTHFLQETEIFPHIFYILLKFDAHKKRLNRENLGKLLDRYLKQKNLESQRSNKLNLLLCRYCVKLYLLCKRDLIGTFIHVIEKIYKHF